MHQLTIDKIVCYIVFYTSQTICLITLFPFLLLTAIIKWDRAFNAVSMFGESWKKFIITRVLHKQVERINLFYTLKGEQRGQFF